MAIVSRRLENPGQPALELRCCGESPQLLLLHGANCNAEVWEPLMLALAERGVSSWAMSVRGHGLSDGAESLQDAGLLDYVADVRRVLASLDPCPVLVGHSMGGLVAQLTAMEHPLPGLVLISSVSAKGVLADGLRLFAQYPVGVLRSIARRSYLPLFTAPGMCRTLMFNAATAEETVAFCEACHQQESWRANKELETLLPDPSRIHCPVLVLGGQEDAIISPQSVCATAALYGADAVLLPARGHMLPLEAGQGHLARLLQGFLAERVEGGTGGGGE